MVEPDGGRNVVRNRGIRYLYRSGISHILCVVLHGIALHDGLRVV